MPSLMPLRSLVLCATIGVIVVGCGGATGATSAPIASSSHHLAPHASIRASEGGARTPVGTISRSRPPGPLTGAVIGIDPGHNGDNYTDSAFINKLVWNGRAQEACDTTGTATDGGYPESRFTFNVATDLAADLRRAGAQVVMTRHNNHGVGPCITRRARIINRAHADVAIDIHADGGPPDGRGFTILEPVADGPNDGVINSSAWFGREVRDTFLRVTGMPVSTYDGTNGITTRDDLAGLNLTTVPKVLIECGNMRNATDAGLLVSKRFQQQAASALATAITTFVAGGQGSN